MSTTVIALFRDPSEAEAAAEALRSAHFDSARIGVVTPGDVHLPKFGRSAIEGVSIGAIGCAIAGMVIGVVLAGVLPGMSPVLPGGLFAVLMFVVAGAATGALAGGLISQSMSRQDDLYYEEEVAAGRTLVTVVADAGQVEEARRILLDRGAFEAAPIDSPMRKAS